MFEWTLPSYWMHVFSHLDRGCALQALSRYRHTTRTTSNIGLESVKKKYNIIIYNIIYYNN